MDNLLAGNWLLPFGGVAYRCVVQRHYLWKIIPGASRTPFRGQPKSVRLPPGIVFAFIPESLFGISPERCSASPRNPVRLRPESRGEVRPETFL